MLTTTLSRLLAAATLVVAPLATTLGAQQPTPPQPAPSAVPLPAAQAPASTIPLDRVVAVVGDSIVLWSDVMEVINQRRAQGMQLPQDSAGQAALARSVVSELVDELLLVQQAAKEKVEITDNEVNQRVDEQVKRVRAQFNSEQEFRTALRQNGFGSPEEHRRWLADQVRRSLLQQQLMQKLKQEGKLVQVAVSDADVQKAFEANRANLPRRPATVSFRQVIIAHKPSAAARAAARAKAESLLVEIRNGGDFAQIAKRESMDPGTKEQGGDLGWNRRGTMVPEFDRVMFALRPGQVSGVVETVFGYHIIKVDRVQPAEVKARHILIAPKLDSNDVARAHTVADSVAALWRSGVPFDTLVKKYHDPSEYSVIADPFPRDSLPASYAQAFAGKKAGDITDPFQIPNPRTGFPKFVVAQISTASEGGEYTLAEFREQVRDQLQQERSFRRYIDGLRKETYVDIRL